MTQWNSARPGRSGRYSLFRRQRNFAEFGPRGHTKARVVTSPVCVVMQPSCPRHAPQRKDGAAPAGQSHPRECFVLSRWRKYGKGEGANLCLSQLLAKSNQRLLSAVSCSFEPGTFTAVMGPSGAGKTTLLNAVAGRLKKQNPFKLEGRVLVNGERMKRKVFEHLSAYVFQVLPIPRSVSCRTHCRRTT